MWCRLLRPNTTSPLLLHRHVQPCTIRQLPTHRRIEWCAVRRRNTNQPTNPHQLRRTPPSLMVRHRRIHECWMLDVHHQTNAQDQVNHRKMPCKRLCKNYGFCMGTFKIFLTDETVGKIVLLCFTKRCFRRAPTPPPRPERKADHPLAIPLVIHYRSKPLTIHSLSTSQIVHSVIHSKVSIHKQQLGTTTS